MFRFSKENLMKMIEVAQDLMEVQMNIKLNIDYNLHTIGCFNIQTNTIEINPLRLIMYSKIDDKWIYFSIIHEVRHAIQVYNGDLKCTDGNYIEWKDGTKISANEASKLSVTNIDEYNKLPWEEDANTFADIYYPILRSMMEKIWRR